MYYVGQLLAGLVFTLSATCSSALNKSSESFIFINEFWGNYHGDKYRHFSEAWRLQTKLDAKNMFYFAYDSYMKYAFPQDELNPIACCGRGPDISNPSNLNINDVLGNFSLGLVDSLDTLAIMGNSSEFKNAVQVVLDNVSFDLNSTVQVFETNIRVLGSLLSAHIIITDPKQPFGDMRPANYDNELLSVAHDLAVRLLPAFENSKSGIPFPRVNLRYGVPNDTITHTATAGAGSLLLEFGTLSRLMGDPTFENAARRAVDAVWARRSSHTGLIGVAIDVITGKWVGRQSGLGAGVDSFFEYLLKAIGRLTLMTRQCYQNHVIFASEAYILFGEKRDLEMFNEAFKSIKDYLRRGRKHCNRGSGDPPIYVNVDVFSGHMVNTWIDSLQAFLPGLLVLNGDIEEAICSHALHYAIWRRYDALPERFNWQLKAPDVRFYPLRPELIESTYLLYRATKNPFYLHVGREILDSLERHARTNCGYASLHNVLDKSQEDRMESFFLSETCKYLYLLFDFENPLHHEASMQTIFTTEGHLLPTQLDKNWEDYLDYCHGDVKPSNTTFYTKRHCDKVTQEHTFSLPLRRDYFQQLTEMVGHVT